MIRIERSIRAQFLLCAVFYLLPILRAEEAPVFDAVWSEVERQSLWEDPEWWTLGHYHRTLIGLVRSRVDDERFFLSPDGKASPKAELKATLKAFVEGGGEGEDGEGNPRSVSCRFPARRAWLLRKLELPEDVFAASDCEDYLTAIETLGLDQAVVIYPSAYMNSPASMFGHLLLVIDREGKDRLLSRAANYAARVEDSFGPLFAIKGIFGLYSGVYTLLPYYEKVEEYAAVNRRDIWEYPLNLSEEELDQLLRHVWELQTLESRYFFFKENCAFNLLYPIEAAKPSVALTRRFRASAVPVSLLQQLTETGITGEPTYRPSKSTRMRALALALTKDEQQRALALAEGEAVVESDSPQVLSLAVEMTQYRYTEQAISPDVYRGRVFPLLRARSARGKIAEPDIPIPLPPSAGHGPQRLDVYGGVDKAGAGYGGFRWRAAYHDLMDDPRGYAEGQAITFFGVDVWQAPDREGPSLRRFSLVDIRSLSPPELWVTPLSWAAGLRVESDPFDETHHRTLASFATGLSLRGAGERPVYVMLSQAFRVDPALDDGAAWEPGVQWGGFVGGPRLRGGLQGWHHWGVLGADGQRHRITFDVRHSFTVESSLGLQAEWVSEDGRERLLTGAAWFQTF